MALDTNALTTLALVKKYLRIPALDTSEDEELEDFINDATGVIEGYCHRPIKVTTTDVTELVTNNGSGQIFPLRTPVTLITSIAYATGPLNAPVYTLLDPATAYQIDPFTGVINVDPTVLGNTFRLIYRGGYAVVPRDIQRACNIIVGDIYNRRNSDGAVNESVGGASASWEKDIPERAKALLNNYVRYRF